MPLTRNGAIFRGYRRGAESRRRDGEQRYPDRMSGGAMTILRGALALSYGDRADLAAELLATLPAPGRVVEIDSEEFLRRSSGATIRELRELGWWSADHLHTCEHPAVWPLLDAFQRGELDIVQCPPG